ncbi:MAG: hypothetical protein NT062_03175 [Proteobacteria bacterium]|nr:hypothetical protein [Pseudomonadota bacterium]
MIGSAAGRIDRIVTMARLARWLGPWADSTRVPADIAVRDELVGELRVRVFGAGGTRATYLVAPGLHYAGVDDPRMDRFCRILASAGGLVVAPFVPDYLALRPRGRAKRDFARVFAHLANLGSPPGRKPIVFSISFGSLLALSLAATHGDAIDRLVLFGGYADLATTLQFALTGEVLGSGRIATRDPLNQPVVLANLVDQLEDLAAADRDALVAHWRRYVERVWGRPEMKARDRYVAIALELAADVPPALRALFLVGIGVTPGARELAARALRAFDARELDPTPHLAAIRCRVELVHGTDDDVIPFEQSHALAAQLPHARVHLTGMYNHTRAMLPSPGALARELRTMGAILDALV